MAFKAILYHYLGSLLWIESLQAFLVSTRVCPDVEREAVFIVSGIRPFSARRSSISIVCVCHKSVYKSSGHFRRISLTLLASRTSKCNMVLFRMGERKRKERKRRKAFRETDQNFSGSWTHKASQWLWQAFGVPPSLFTCSRQRALWKMSLQDGDFYLHGPAIFGLFSSFSTLFFPLSWENLLIYKAGAAANKLLKRRLETWGRCWLTGNFWSDVGGWCLWVGLFVVLWKLQPFPLLLSYHFPSLIPGDW